jgi:hypothetical protein
LLSKACREASLVMQQEAKAPPGVEHTFFDN